MTHDELDDELRERFLTNLDLAHKFASENRDVESLGQIAQLIGQCIDWDKERKDDIPVGFMSNREEDNE